MKTMEMTQGKELPIWFYTFFCDEQLDHHKTKINTKLDTQWVVKLSQLILPLNFVLTFA